MRDSVVMLPVRSDHHCSGVVINGGPIGQKVMIVLPIIEFWNKCFLGL